VLNVRYLCCTAALLIMDKKTGVLILCFLVLNLIQAAFTQLTGDEALYWMYWNHLDFGFKDHPPLIGIVIGSGYFFIKNELGARIGVALLNAAMLWCLYKLVKPTRLVPFALLILSIPVFSLYGFIATPDAPLMLATVLFLVVWQRFLESASVANTLLLGGCMALLMWSKYQGILIILFTLLPLKEVWRSKRYWMAAALGILLYSPHLIWQAANDFVTIKFHLSGRNNDAWELKHILGYAAGQLGVFNPIVLVYSCVVLIKTKAASPFEKSIRWAYGSILILFFINSFRGRVEPHWTAPLALCAVYFIYNYWREHKPSGTVLFALGSFAALLLVARCFMVVDVLPQLHRDFHRNRQKMAALHELADNKPVCFMNSYQNPSLYMFYTGRQAHSINNIDGGKNQYDYWDYGALCHEQTFLFVSSYDHPSFTKQQSGEFTFSTRWYNTECSATIGDSAQIPAWLINANIYPLSLMNRNHTFKWSAEFNHKKSNEASAAVSLIGIPEVLNAGDSARVVVAMKWPLLQGKNKMCIAAAVDSLPATYQSNWVEVQVNK
jgi:Dolichyl-phosphate-mannose-protein mannosyltransferase